MPVRRLALTAALAAVIALPAPPALGATGTQGDTSVSAQDRSSPRQLLRRAEARYRELRSLRARFHQTVEVPLLNKERTGEGTWYQKGRGRFKMDFERPPEDVIVADGTHLWLYYPSTHPGQVIRTTIEASTTGSEMADLQGRIFEEASRGYAVEYVGLEAVSGVETHHLALEPTGKSPYRRVEVWIGTDDLLVRRFVIEEENGTVRTVTLRDLEPDAAIPDSAFRFRVPSDAEVFSG